MPDRQTKVVLSAQVSGYVKGMEEAAKKTREVGSEAEKLAQKRQAFEQLGRGMVIAGTAITAVTALSIKAAIDWETAWAGVTKTVDGSAAQMSELEGELRNLATTLPATHEEIAAVAEAAGQLGVAREDITGFTKTMIDLAETTNLTADEAATSIAQFMNIFQTAPQDVDNLGSALVALGNDGASTERDIIQMSQRIAGAATIIGLTEGETLGLANALASVGIEAEAGGSSVSNIMIDIANAVSQKGEKLLEWSKLAGLGADEFAAKYKSAPAEALALVIEGMGKLNAAGGDVFATLSNLGQTDVRVTRSLLGLASSGDLLRNSLELGNEAWADNNALVEEARKRYETTEARLQIAGNSVKDAAIDFGQVFLPAVKSAADGVAGFTQMLTDLPDPVQGIIGIFGGVVGVLALVGGTALLAVPKIAEFRTAMQTLNVSAGRFALVGGGVALALTAVVVAVGTLAAKQAQAQARAENYASALEQGADAAKDLAIQNLAVEKSVLGLNFGSAYDNAEKLGISLDVVTEAAQGNQKALKELREVLDIATGGGEPAQKMADELGISLIDLAQSAGTLSEAIDEENAGLERGEQIQKQTKKATDDTTDSTKSAADAYVEAAEGVADLEGQIRTLVDTINEANGVGQDAVTANINYQDSLAAVEEQIKNIREGVEGFSGGLDIATQAGRDNKDMLVGLAQDAQEAADAQFNLDHNTETYRATLEASRQTLIDRAKDLGATEEEAQALADTIFSIPSDTEWKLIAETSEAAARIEAIANAISGLKDKTVKVNITRPDGTPVTDQQLANQFGIGGYAMGGAVRRYATGGGVFGAGTATSDSIPALLSNDEHVVTAAEVKGAGGHRAVEAWRRSWVKTAPGYATGGPVSAAPVVTAPSGPSRFDLVLDDGTTLTGYVRDKAGAVVGAAMSPFKGGRR